MRIHLKSKVELRMYLPYERLPNPTSRFEVYEELAEGVNAKIFRALEIETGRVVALKIQHYDQEHRNSIEEEYRTLRDNTQHPNLPQFFGAYRLPKHHGPDEIWFVLEVNQAHGLLWFIF